MLLPLASSSLDIGLSHPPDKDGEKETEMVDYDYDYHCFSHIIRDEVFLL